LTTPTIPHMVEDPQKIRGCTRPKRRVAKV